MNPSYSSFSLQFSTPKFQKARLLAVVAALFSVLLPLAGQAASIDYWDPTGNDAGAGSGGTGNWNTSSANWYGGTNDTPWPNTTSSIADFAGTAGTVTLTTAITAGGLIFGAPGYLLTGGTLSIDASGINASALSSGATTIASATVLTATQAWSVGSGAALADDGVISGSYVLTKSGPGLLLIGGTGAGATASQFSNTFTGGVAINAGTLGIYEGQSLGSAPGSPATDLTFTGNSTLQFEANPSSGTLNANRQILINPGVTATIDTQGYSAAIGGIISGSGGSLTKMGSGTLSLDNAETYSGLTTINAGTLALGSNSPSTGTLYSGTSGALVINSGGTLRFDVSNSLGNAGSTSTAAAITVNAGGTLASNNSFTELDGATFDGGTLVANGGSYGAAFGLGGTVTAGGATASSFNAGTGSGDDIMLGQQATNNSTTFNVAVTGTTGADLIVNTPFINNYTVSGTAANSGLIKTGAGALVLEAANTYTGATIINAGTLALSGSGTLYSGTSGAVAINAGGTLRFDSNSLFGSAGSTTTAAAITVNAGGTLASNNSFTELNGVTFNGGTLVANGGSFGAAFGLGGAVTVDGATTANFNAGTGSSDNIMLGQQATNNSTTFNVAVTGGTGAGLIVNLPLINNFTVSGTAAASGMVKTGLGTMALEAAGSYSGGTTILAGTLNFGNTGALGSGAVTIGNATLQAGAAGTLANSLLIASGSSATFDTQANTVTLSGSLAGAGSLTKIGSGALILTTQGSLSPAGGGITLDAGTLGIYAGNNLGAIPGGVTDLTFAGNSTLQFETAAGSGAIASGRQFAINSGVTATFDTQSYNNTDAGSIVGAGALTKIGSGVLTLSGNDSYSGGTTINGGALQLGNAGALGSAAASLAINGATLDMNGFSATAGTFTIQNGSILGFDPRNASNDLSVSSAIVTGTDYIGINGATIVGTGTFNLITSSGGGLAGAFQFAGAQDLTVPVSSLIVSSGSGGFYRITLNNTNNAEQLIVSNNLPATELTIMPFGSSITAGYSAQNPYDGGGYRTQLYQNLVNDGRFIPNFVGSATNLYSVNPANENILTESNQLDNEGHPGWTTSQMLANLNAYDGNTNNNGGYWLAPGNGVNPNYITVNIGGNDAADNLTSGAVQRLDSIITEINALRSGTASPTTIISTICYRGDYNSSAGETNGTLLDSSYNPYLAGVVFNHVLAGQSVGYLDLRNVMDYSTDNDLSYGDLVHFTQAGYDKMANAWYQSIVYGAAYWTGSQGSVWNTVVGGSTNWATSRTLATDRGKSLNDPGTTTYDIYPDVFFSNNSTALNTTLGADTTIRSLNFTSGATGPVTIGGTNTLTIGSIDTSPDSTNPDTLANSGGITVQAGSGAHTLATNVVLGADQTWGNVSANPFTVSGVVSGSNNLEIAGSYTIYQPGSITSGVVGSSSEVVSTTGTMYVGSGSFVLAGNNTYTGRTTIDQYGTLQLGGTNAGGGATGAIDSTSGVVDNGTLIFNRSNAYNFHPDISGSGSVCFTGGGTVTLFGTNTYTGATTVKAGGLAVSGEISGSTVYVAPGATLGSGGPGAAGIVAPTSTSSNAVVVGGTLSPGMSGSFAQIDFALQPGGKLNFQSGSSLLFDLGANDTSDGVAFSEPGDWLSGSGNASLALNGTVSYSGTYTIFSNVTTTGFTFAAITGYNTADYLARVTQAGNAYDLTFQAVPEPETWPLIIAGAGTVLLRGRRRIFRRNPTDR